MSSAALRFSISPKVDNRGRTPVPAGSESLPEGCGEDLLARAALFRAEADSLRERASSIDEPVIRNQYFQLADRWLVLAAGLEAELFTRLIP
jgi:hypothetical protein